MLVGGGGVIACEVNQGGLYIILCILGHTRIGETL